MTFTCLLVPGHPTISKTSTWGCKSMLTSNLKKEKLMEVGCILPNLPPSPLLVLRKRSSLLRSNVPTLSMAVPSSKTRKQPSWGKGSTCEMAKPCGKGTPSRAGYSKRQPSTKQQRVVTGSAELPAESNLMGLLCSGEASPLRRLGSRELEGFSPLGGQGNKPSICRRKSKNKRSFS